MLDKNCQRCNLSKFRTNVVNFELVPENCNPEIIFVGMAPGESEDKSGQPFIGPAGIRLRSILDSVRNPDLKYMLTNVVKCTPIRDTSGDIKTPNAEEIKQCSRHLLQELQQYRDCKVVVPLGDMATRTVLNTSNIKISKVRGIPIKGNLITIVPTYHPSYIIRKEGEPDYNRILNEFISDIEVAIQTSRGMVARQPKEITLVDNKVGIQTIVRKIREFGTYSLDVESNIVNPYLPNFILATVGFGFPDETNYVVPVRHSQIQTDLIYGDEITAAMESYTPIVHYGNFDIVVMLRHTNVKKFPGVHDCIVSERLLYHWMDRDHGLKELAYYVLGISRWDEEVQRYKIQGIPYSDIPIEILYPYNGKDCWATTLLHQSYMKDLDKLGMKRYYDYVIPEQIWQWLKIENRGQKICKPFLQELGKIIDRESEQLFKKIREEPIIKEFEAEHQIEFNPRSPAHQATIFVSKLGLKPFKVTPKTGMPKIDKVFRECYKDDYPIVDMIHTLKTTFSDFKSKFVNQFLNALENSDHPEWLIHPSFSVVGTETGRPSSRSPNVLNIPRKGFKETFYPQLGHLFFNIDYSQIELRIMAHLSQDPVLIDAYRTGKDVHKITASRINYKAIEEITKDERYEAKELNFGIPYGKTPHGIIDAIRKSTHKTISYEEAELLLNEWFKAYPTVKFYFDQQKNEAKITGRRENMFGKIRWIPGVFNSDLKIREHALRAAGNYPIQSSAWEICADPIRNLGNEYTIYNSVYDSVMFELPATNVSELKRHMKRIVTVAENPRILHDFGIVMSVPILVDCQIGLNWGDMIDVPREWILS